MSSFRRTFRSPQLCVGQTIYVTLLILSCIALAAAIFFPVFEYVDLYRGEDVRLHKFEATGTRMPSSAQPATPKPEAPAAEEAPAGEGEATAEPAEGAEEAPAPVDTAAPEGG